MRIINVEHANSELIVWHGFYPLVEIGVANLNSYNKHAHRPPDPLHRYTLTYIETHTEGFQSD